MKRIISLSLIAAVCLAATSCSESIIKKMQMAENVVTECNPSPLQVKNGQIPAKVTVTCPKGYFAPKAIVEITPVLVYEGGEAKGPVFTYQGEKVKDNFKVVPQEGGIIVERLSFTYIPQMAKSTLELRGVLTFNGKKYDLPVRKIAEGCVTTSLNAIVGVTCDYKADGYKAVIEQSTEGQIMYTVNSSVVRKSELTSDSIKKMQEDIEDLKNNERVTIGGTEIISYASPEGGEKFNAKLSDRRAATAEQAWKKLNTGIDSEDAQIKSVGQDWDGFKEAVTKSDIQDKDLILRVLSMYSDPAVRESEIRNISQIFTELKKEVLPELRRARFVTKSTFKNFTDEELGQMSKKGLEGLDEPAILHLAAIAEDTDVKAALYEAAVDKFGSETALYNLACTYIKDGDADKAKECLDNLENKNDKDVENAYGVVKIMKGDYAGAAENFKKAGTKENLGALDIIAGNYDSAIKNLEGTESDNLGLAYILAGEYNKALSSIKGTSANSDYLRAVASARIGDTSNVKKYLDSACAKDPSLKAKAAKDIEFVKYL
ncbi:MAG: hypothetical protein MJY48_05855 [Bacteroidales bacterium]|nr:hypothetical protein [Bacteroidales bacterium]